MSSRRGQPHGYVGATELERVTTAGDAASEAPGSLYDEPPNPVVKEALGLLFFCFYLFLLLKYNH
jgi:hypothetical protein